MFPGKRVLSLALVLSLISGIGMFSLNNSVFATTYNTYYVSPNGDDSNDGGGIDRPFKTIEKARDVIRGIPTMTSDITVKIMPGTYYLTQPLTFTSADSGRNGYWVKYCNESTMPVISGGKKIADTSWVNNTTNYYAGLTTSIYPYAIYEEVNGEYKQATLARYPNKNGKVSVYNTVAAVAADPANRKSQFYYGTGANYIPTITGNRDNLQVSIWPGGSNGLNRWSMNIINVRPDISPNPDTTTRLVTLSRNAGEDLTVGSAYYIQGAYALLDQNGEFFYNPTYTALYYKSFTGGAPTNVTVPQLKRVIDIKGTSSSNRATNIRFEGLEIRDSNREAQLYSGYTRNGGITLENANNIKIVGCKIHAMGDYGIFMQDYTSYNTVQNNEIYDIGNSGVYIKPNLSRTVKSNNHTITNNHVHDIGFSAGHAAGIAIYSSPDNMVSYNTVHDTSRYSITIDAPHPAALVTYGLIDGEQPTLANAREFTHATGNIIKFNDTSRANKESEDTGVIHTWGVDAGNTIENNHIHDSGAPISVTHGIYCDDGSDGVLIQNNLIENLLNNQEGQLGKLKFAAFLKGVGDVFRNNVVAGNDLEVTWGGAIGTQPMNGCENKDLVSEKNVIYTKGTTGINYYRYNSSTTYNPNSILSSNYNVFRHGTTGNQQVNIANVPGVTTLATWTSVYGHDANSAIATSSYDLFVNQTTRDYRLHPNSLARTKGIAEIDFKNIGTTTAFPFRNITQEVDRLFIRTLLSDTNQTIQELEGGTSTYLAVSGRTKITGYLLTSAEMRTTGNNATITYSDGGSTLIDVAADGLVTANGTGTGTVPITVTYTRTGYPTLTKVFYIKKIS